MSNNRYSNTPIDNLQSGKQFYHTTIFPTIPVSDSDIYIMSRDGDRLDSIASRFYGDSTLWWIVAQANNLEDSFFIPPGTRLRIPQDVQGVIQNVLITNEGR
jgi:phage tail protein X